MRRPKGRASLAFALGLVLAAGLASGVDLANTRFSRNLITVIRSDTDQIQPITDTRPLTTQEQSAARTAWAYFENNSQTESGLVNSVDGFPSTTLWDMGSYVLAMVAANRLGLIDDQQLKDRGRQLFGALATLELFNDQLPNKAYHTISLKMVDYDNQPVPLGIGWSALDIARLYIGLRVLVRQQPEFAPVFDQLLTQWDLQAMVGNGELFGADLGAADGGFRRVQEGRLGYEQYAARAAALLGLDTISAVSARRIVDWQRLDGGDVPIDRRNSAEFEALTVTLIPMNIASDPF